MEKYKDIDLSLTKNPITRDINPIFDIDAIKRSVKNLVLVGFFERRLNPYIGSYVYQQLFENITPFTIVKLKRTISDVINRHEPRIELISVDIDVEEDNNFISATISFFVRNIPKVHNLTITLERLR